jgi:hypothetical protein
MMEFTAANSSTTGGASQKVSSSDVEIIPTPATFSHWGASRAPYPVGSFCEGYYGALGWNPLVFRLWYLFGAILVAAWLGQGTVYLLARRKWANGLMTLAELDPNLMTTSVHTGSELSGHAIVTPGVRLLTPLFNLYGTVTLVGGAAWSA